MTATLTFLISRNVASSGLALLRRICAFIYFNATGFHAIMGVFGSRLEITLSRLDSTEPARATFICLYQRCVLARLASPRSIPVIAEV